MSALLSFVANLKALLPFIAHWTIAATLIGAAVALYILAPQKWAKQLAIAVGVGAAVWIVGYAAGDRDGATYWKGQLQAYIAAEGKVTDARVQHEKEVGDAAVAKLLDQLSASQADEAEAWQIAARAEATPPRKTDCGLTQEEADEFNK